MGDSVQNISDYQQVGAAIAARPISASDMIYHLKLPTTLSADASFVSYMESLIDAAIASAEGITKRTMRESRFRGYLTEFQTGRTAYEIRKSPLQAVESITYLASGVVTTIAASQYQVALNPDFSRVHPVVDADWPSTIDDVLHASTWTFTAGYKAGEIPASLLYAMKQHVAYLYVQRGDCDTGTDGVNGCIGCPLPPAVKAVYQSHRIFDMRIGL